MTGRYILKAYYKILLIFKKPSTAAAEEVKRKIRASLETLASRKEKLLPTQLRCQSHHQLFQEIIFKKLGFSAKRKKHLSLIHFWSYSSPKRQTKRFNARILHWWSTQFTLQFPFLFFSWERAWVENFVVLESPWTKIGKIWDRNKIPPQDVLHLLVKGKNMNTWNKIHGSEKLKEWMMDKNFLFLLLAHSHFHFRRSVFSSLLCKAYFSENGENGKSIKWTGTTGKTLT